MSSILQVVHLINKQYAKQIIIKTDVMTVKTQNIYFTHIKFKFAEKYCIYFNSIYLIFFSVVLRVFFNGKQTVIICQGYLNSKWC